MNMKRFQWMVLFSLLIAAAMLVPGVGAAPKDFLKVSLSSAQSQYSSSQDVLVTLSISNPNKNSVRILKWFTPANGVEEAILAVTLNGEAVAYTGAVYKRPAATGNDYITLKAGESLSNTLNLGEYYDLSRTGNYEISYSASSYILYSEKGNGFKSPDTLVSQSIQLKVEARAAKVKPTPIPPPPPGGTAYKSCTTTQQAILASARNQAKTYAADADGYLLTNKSTTPRYVEWFGTYLDSRHTTVSTHFTALHNAWDNAGVTFNCGCKQNYYAYVYPNKPYEITLCKVFWVAPLAGTDSQGGTLIHEMSHFYVVASTQDYVYGQTGARSLAVSSPAQAIMNADNHEYFAENNPSLP